MSVPPASTKRSSWACEPASSVSAPKVIVPSASVDTAQPLRPSVRYSIVSGPPRDGQIRRGRNCQAERRERRLADRSPRPGRSPRCSRSPWNRHEPRLLRRTSSAEGIEDRRPHGRRQHDLPAMRRVTDARRFVHRQTDVAGLGQRRAAAVNADPHPHVDAVRPRAGVHRALDRRVRPRAPPAAGSKTAKRSSARASTSRPPALPHGRARCAAHIGEQRGVPVLEAREQFGRALDIRQQKRDVALRQLPLRLQLRADEPDRARPRASRPPARAASAPCRARPRPRRRPGRTVRARSGRAGRR